MIQFINDGNKLVLYKYEPSDYKPTKDDIEYIAMKLQQIRDIETGKLTFDHLK